MCNLPPLRYNRSDQCTRASQQQPAAAAQMPASSTRRSPYDHVEDAVVTHVERSARAFCVKRKLTPCLSDLCCRSTCRGGIELFLTDDVAVVDLQLKHGARLLTDTDRATVCCDAERRLRQVAALRRSRSGR